jgi:phosphoribosylanthranilate isomerase
MIGVLGLSRYTRVKICGIRDEVAAMAAVRAGADALGFVFAPSKRMVSPDRAKEIISVLPPFVARVGVFVDAPARDISEIAEYVGLDVIQLHGAESVEICGGFRQKVIKAFSVGQSLDTDEINRFPADAYLFDTLVAGLQGGTGRTFDWRLIDTAAIARPVILAGGIHPDNVREAIAAVSPYGVDVSSGVETDGVKDPIKITEFIRRVKSEG